MSKNRQDFARRINKLSRKHKAVSRAHSVTMAPDGLIHVRPRRQFPKPPLRMLVLAVAILFVFKSALLSHLGDAAYTERLDKLATGNVSERAGAWVMQIDPVTQFIATQIGSALR